MVGNVEFAVEDFISELYRLLNFAIKWIEMSAKIDLEDKTDVADLISDRIRETFNELSKLFKIIGKRPDLKRVYGNLVIEWGRESNEPLKS